MTVLPAPAHLSLLFGRHLEVGLDDLDFLAVRHGFEPSDIRILDEELPFDLIRLRFPEVGRDLRDQSFHLSLEPCRIVNDPEMGMSGPCGDEFVIHGSCLGGALFSRGVVCRRVELLRAFGCRHEMEYRVVAVPEFHFIDAEVLKDGRESLLVHVHFIVQFSPVAYDEHFILLHRPGSLLIDLFLLQLHPHLAVLVIRVGPAGPWRDSAADQLRRGLRHEQYRIAFFYERILDPAERGRLAGTGAAGDHDLGNTHRHLLAGDSPLSAYFTVTAVM